MGRGMIELRDYQRAAIDALYAWFRAGRGSPLVVAPTGSGKSVILAEFARSAVVAYPETRILIVTHVRELIAQNHAALIRLWPDAPAGIYSAGLGKRQLGRQVLVAGVQSIARRARDLGHVDLAIVDEAHLVPRASDTQYGRLFDGLRATNPNLKVIGLTATPYRLDSGLLHGGENALFDGIAYDIPIGMLVERGHLAPLISKRPAAAFDTAGLHRRMGEFVEREMLDRFGGDATRAAVAEIVELGRDRRSWIAFCISVEHARAVRDELRAHGIAAETVTGETPGPERDRFLRAYRAGQVRALTSVGRADHRLRRAGDRPHRHAAADRLDRALHPDGRARHAHRPRQGRLPGARLRRQRDAARAGRRHRAARGEEGQGRRRGGRAAGEDLPGLRRHRADRHARVSRTAATSSRRPSRRSRRPPPPRRSWC